MNEKIRPTCSTRNQYFVQTGYDFAVTKIKKQHPELIGQYWSCQVSPLAEFELVLAVHLETYVNICVVIIYFFDTNFYHYLKNQTYDGIHYVLDK